LTRCAPRWDSCAIARWTEPGARVRAVLVGVDVYERADVPPLRGCVNDVILVRRILKEYFGVPNQDIRVVVNARATKANILHRLTTTIERAQPGDVVVFYFSGHGSQIRDRDGDELADALDEVICPYDMDWDRGTYVMDDDLDRVFGSLPEGVTIEAFFDCCFYGAGPREFTAEPRPQALRDDLRWLPPPLDIAARAEGEEEWLEYHQLSQASGFAETHVYWGATREGQPAAEDYFQGRAHGIFTYWGCRFIEENAERMYHEGYSREQLLEDVRAYLHSLGYAQTPELAAPDELRLSDPFLPAGWGAWVQAGGPRRR
jgi:hypothetical protein